MFALSRCDRQSSHPLIFSISYTHPAISYNSPSVRAKRAEGFSDNLSAYCSPDPPSLYLEGGWSDNFFFVLTGKDFYMPQFANLRGPIGGEFMTVFYHRFTWDGYKFRMF